MVLKIFGALAGLVKVRLDNTFIDSHVFRLHYRWTTSFCFIACALIAATEYIGDPIQCTHRDKPVDKPVNTYCWIESTFTINTSYANGKLDGLGNADSGKHEKTFHAYYQWVPFVLFFQGCLFYLPHLLWKSFENKTAHTLLQGLQHNSLDPEIASKKDNIIKYLKASRGRNYNYSVVYFICEALNFVNVVGQIFLLDAFFGGAFLNYGTKALQYLIDEQEDDPFVTAFPKITQCKFVKYGPSGTPIHETPLCILPQNILNEKIFIIMWFWFVTLANITVIQLIWRLVVCFTPSVRLMLFQRRGRLGREFQKLEKFIQHLRLGDYFLLDILGRHLDALTFRDILEKAIMNEDANGNNPINAYRPLTPVRGPGSPADDDDPISFKRQMEANEGAGV